MILHDSFGKVCVCVYVGLCVCMYMCVCLVVSGILGVCSLMCVDRHMSFCVPPPPGHWGNKATTPDRCHYQYTFEMHSNFTPLFDKLRQAIRVGAGEGLQSLINCSSE